MSTHSLASLVTITAGIAILFGATRVERYFRPAHDKIESAICRGTYTRRIAWMLRAYFLLWRVAASLAVGLTGFMLIYYGLLWIIGPARSH